MRAQTCGRLRECHRTWRLGGDSSLSERAACIAPYAEKFDNQKPRAASLLFVRRGTQSYDEFIAAVPL